MNITSLQLKNYRNYESLDISLDRGTNIFYGDNAQGKTNILEAIYVCGTTKSHRGSKDREIISFSEEESHIRTMLNRDGITYRIDMHLKKNRPKGVAVNGIPIRRARELFGILNIVFFAPEDLNIIKNGPSERRRFIDMELCQLDSLYITYLSDYNKLLDQRNKLLKDLYINPSLRDTLDIWDEQLVTYGSKIIKKREEFSKELDDLTGDIHKKLTGGRELLKIHYEKNVSSDKFMENLISFREKDIKLKTTTCGPHRDDLCLLVNGKDLRKYGSQGQQRTAALSLKLAEIYLVKSRIHDSPILLLDDVLSELDCGRQNYLLESIHDIQTLVTCTGLDDFVSHQFKINKVFHVVEGKVF